MLEQLAFESVANVKTPTILFVGQQTPRGRCPQSVERYRGLKSNGIPTPLYVALHELHVWEERRRELFKMNVELEWFEKSATKRPYSWEHVPEAGRTTQHAHDAPVVTIARLPRSSATEDSEFLSRGKGAGYSFKLMTGRAEQLKMLRKPKTSAVKTTGLWGAVPLVAADADCVIPLG